MRQKTTVPTVLAIILFAASLAAQAPSNPPSPAMHPMMAGEGKMMESCKAMMAKHEQMTTEMATMDAKLDSLVAAMDAAKGSKKADAVAAVVSEMVAQRKAMREKMEAMHPMMMGHMMEHMRMGMMEGMMKSMSACPMMQHGEGAASPHQR